MKKTTSSTEKELAKVEAMTLEQLNDAISHMLWGWENGGSSRAEGLSSSA